ncbi:histidine phosphatase family protein [Catenulispora rubra]|uniref:histidine phosphatase family protein n=1 Tax=Catenulispora rubra TaxID=280293 RepID=UPI001E5DF439|nr:histidine phosphatase family protein [Catenulispora rubra]
MNAPARIWCLRHAESQNVTAGVSGAVPAASLTDRGHAQAEAMAGTLAAEPIVAICTSTALRTRQTAGPLAAARGLPIQALPDLAEVGIGSSEGSADPAIGRRTADVLRAWIVDGELSQQVSDGETGHQVLARMTTAFCRIAAVHPGESIAVIGHVASLTLALDRLCALDGLTWGTPLPHAEPFLIEHDRHRWRCLAWPGREPMIYRT